MEYSLTPLGREAAKRVRALANWIETSRPHIARTWGERDGGRSGRGAGR